MNTLNDFLLKSIILSIVIAPHVIESSWRVFVIPPWILFSFDINISHRLEHHNIVAINLILSPLLDAGQLRW